MNNFGIRYGKKFLEEAMNNIMTCELVTNSLKKLMKSIILE